MMIGAILTFITLFALVKTFERHREDLDAFQVATVVIVPTLSMVLVQIAFAFIYPSAIAMTLASTSVLVVLTFIMLYKTLEISPIRSLAYTGTVLLLNVLMAVFVLGG